MADKLTDDEVAAAIADTDWTREGDAIVCELECADFAAALAYVNRVAEAAEAANHHPDILIHGYKRVRLTLSTHSVAGLTQADLDLAATLDHLTA